jgi:hypothetical protein
VAGEGNDQEDAHAAFATLPTCLTVLSGLLAPIVPFIADELHTTWSVPTIPRHPTRFT